MDDNDSLKANHSMDVFEMKFVASKHVHWVILAILIVLMNSFVILLFIFNKNLQKPTNFLLVSLSVSDLLTGMIGLPLVLVCSTRPICLACVFSYTFIVFTSISTVLHILVISYERYIKIVFPFRVQQIGRASFELKVVACLWCFSLFIPPIQFIWWPPTPTSCDEDLSVEDARSERIFTISIMVLFVALPVLLLIYADAMVFLVVRRQLDGIEKTSVGLRDSQRRLRKETRVLTLFAIMMLYFVVAWSFYFASLVIHSIKGREILLPEWIVQFAETLRCSTPLVNPVLYILLKHDFRRAVVVGVRQLLRKYSGMQVDSSVEYSNGVHTSGVRSDSRNYTERTMFL